MSNLHTDTAATHLELSDDMSPLDGALESDEIYEIAQDFGATLTSADMLGAIDDTIRLADDAK